jgi:RNA polymerase sigma factor (sigma-70 family)
LEPVAAPSDAELVARCRAGDADAWRELVERFSRYVYAIALQAFRLPEHEADDVFQDVFTRIYERLDQLRDDEALRPWIGQLVRRTCLDRLRASSRVELTGEDPLLETADHALAEIEEAFDVHRMLAALPGHCQEVLDRFFARDESYRTIGDALDLPAGTIASRISRCLEKLRDEYEGRRQSPRPSSKKAMT